MQGTGFSALFAIGEHIREAIGTPGRAVSPMHIVKNLRHVARSFRVGRQARSARARLRRAPHCATAGAEAAAPAQEDSHEFARYLIEAMQTSCLGGKTLPPGVAETSFVARVFGGRLRSQIKCACCGRDSNTYDPFLDLSLEIVKAPSVDRALARFCATEVLDGDNKCAPPHARRLHGCWLRLRHAARAHAALCSRCPAAQVPLRAHQAQDARHQAVLHRARAQRASAAAEALRVRRLWRQDRQAGACACLRARSHACTHVHQR